MWDVSSSVDFARAVRAISESTRLQSLEVPMFRTPPRADGAVRTLRRTRRGAVVSVAMTERPWVSVLADLIDGVVAVNRLHGHDAIRCRTALWAALERDHVLAA